MRSARCHIAAWKRMDYGHLISALMMISRGYYRRDGWVWGYIIIAFYYYRGAWASVMLHTTTIHTMVIQQRHFGCCLTARIRDASPPPAAPSPDTDAESEGCYADDFNAPILLFLFAPPRIQTSPFRHAFDKPRWEHCRHKRGRHAARRQRHIIKWLWCCLYLMIIIWLDDRLFIFLLIEFESRSGYARWIYRDIYGGFSPRDALIVMDVNLSLTLELLR